MAQLFLLSRLIFKVTSLCNKTQISCLTRLHSYAILNTSGIDLCTRCILVVGSVERFQSNRTLVAKLTLRYRSINRSTKCKSGKRWLFSAPKRMLDKKSPIPLYYQIAEHIKEQIAAGVLVTSEQLPPERDLGEQMGVSRMTVRQAVTHLVTQGLLDVRPGVGTFVAQPKLTYDALHLLGFSEEMARSGAVTESVVLEQSLIVPSPRVATKLNLDPHEKVVWIVRLRRVNQEPVLLETSMIRAALAPDLEDADLSTHSLYKLLEARYALHLQRAHQTVEVVIANDYEQQLFALRSGAAMILLEGVTYGTNDMPVEYFKAIYRGDRCKFELESRRNAVVGESVGAQRLSVVVG